MLKIPNLIWLRTGVLEAWSGTLTGNGTSETFAFLPAGMCSIGVTFAESAAGSVTVMRSRDFGLTWAPLVDGTAVTLTPSGATSVNIVEYPYSLNIEISRVYRLQASLLAGLATYTLTPYLKPNDRVVAPAQA